MNSTVQMVMANRPQQTFDFEAAWKQLERRDAGARFFYGVTTTGVVCRPTCSSRRPLRENVRFFRTVDEARAAGFRPCKKCRPSTAWGDPLDKVRGYIEANHDQPIRLEELGRIAGMSPFTVQRLFKRAMGATPLQYQRALRAGKLRAALKKGSSVTDALYEAGFGSSSRAYEAAPLGMTPARFAKGGKGESIGYCTAQSPFGWIIVGATERGLCWLALGGSKAEAEASLRGEFPEAELHCDPSLAGLVEAALASVRAGDDLSRARATTGPSTSQAAKGATCFAQDDSAVELRSSAMQLDLRGTVFQLRVWNALRQIPRGETRTYSQLARELGEPNATRAVARACALNRVSVLVPCHRVVGVDGSLTGYRWGVERKRKLLEAEKTAISS